MRELTNLERLKRLQEEANKINEEIAGENKDLELEKKKLIEKNIESFLNDLAELSRFGEAGWTYFKLTFYFVSEGRVDFRELVKILASKYKSRIELRQIGPRDEIKVYPNLGMCGIEVCCRTYLQDFEPVTIKMAKEQGLQINMAK